MGKKLTKTKWVGLFVLVNTAIIVLLLCGFELVLRLTDPELKLPVNGLYEGELYTWGHLVINNRFRFRERDFEVPKPKGLLRVIVLGDSFTWGAGLSAEDRYSNILERLLKSKYSHSRIEVLNFGTVGGPTVGERDILRRFKDLVEPDLIVVGFCLNDTQPRSQHYSVERVRFDRKYGPSLGAVCRALGSIGLILTAKRVEKATYRLAELTGAIPRWQVALQKTYERNSREWQEFILALKDIKAMSDGMNLPPPIFAVLNQGTHTDRPTDYNNPDEELETYLRWYHQAEDLARGLGFTTCNYEKEIASQLSDKVLAVNATDVHPSAELNEIYAKKLFDVVEAYIATGAIEVAE